MNTNSKSRKREQFVWPVAGFVIGFLVAMIHSHAGIALYAGIAVWCVAMVLVLVLSAHPIGARIGALLAGLFIAVPCFVRTTPLSRALLACFMAAPFLAAAALVLAPPIAGFRERLAYLFTWCGTRQVKRCAHSFDGVAFLRLVVAATVLAAAIGVIKAASAYGLWLTVRWLAGGIGILASAEMATACLPFVAALLGLTVPPLMQSPYRSASVGEFWTKRWNFFASEKLFRPYCFAPLARHGVALALFTTFALSGLGHTLLAYLALGKWGIAAACGAFFLVQPLLIAAERRMSVRRWRPAAGRAWTLTVLTISSPLFVEPIIQIFERGWGTPDNVLLPTVAVLGFCIAVSSIIALASLASHSTATRVYVA